MRRSAKIEKSRESWILLWFSEFPFEDLNPSTGPFLLDFNEEARNF